MSSLKSNDDLFKVVHIKGVQMADSYGNFIVNIDSSAWCA